MKAWADAVTCRLVRKGKELYRSIPMRFLTLMRFCQRHAARIALIAAGFVSGVYVWMSLAGAMVLMSPFLSTYGVTEVSRYQRVFPGELSLWIVCCVAPFLWLGLGFLKQSHFSSIKWGLVLACSYQLFLAWVFDLFTERFGSDWEMPLWVQKWPTFEQVRMSLSPIERVVYTPVLYLVEHGYGTLALVLHSLVLAAIATGILYALARVYRMWRRPPAAGGANESPSSPDTGGTSA